MKRRSRLDASNTARDGKVERVSDNSVCLRRDAPQYEQYGYH